MEHETMHPELRKEVIKTMAIILKFIGVVEKAIKDGRTGMSSMLVFCCRVSSAH